MSKPIYFFGGGQADGTGDQKALLGGKGAGLAEMSRLGIPVPPGFTLTTEVCSAHYESDGKLPEPLRAEIEGSLRRVGSLVGAGFGDKDSPLLVSVRSGARASMPGMMDTILNLGMNEDVVASLARKTNNPRFALDSYRRFIVAYADIVLGIPKERFDGALDQARRAAANEMKLDIAALSKSELERRLPDSLLPAKALRSLVDQALALIKKESGTPFPSDPLEQLWGAIGAVFRSWHNPRAKIYRAMHQIPESWGTACNIQAMVFGNIDDNSGTGVCFTRDPSTGEKRFFGEWLPNAQGEDVVAGVRTPHPISGVQSPSEGEAPASLEQRHPALYRQLVEIYQTLEHHFRDMMDLEFTVQEGTLYLLQCRAGKRTGPASVRMAVEMVQEKLISKSEALLRVDPASLDQLLHPRLDPAAPKRLIGTGLPASPGAVSGHVVFTAAAAQRQATKGKPILLVRADTSPEDIAGMKAAVGFLTARGGMTSHAAVVARGMGKTCIVGCSALRFEPDGLSMTVNVPSESGNGVESIAVKPGDVLTLDGTTGAVYLGAVPTVAGSASAEFTELMHWADGVRTLGVRANADTPTDARVARSFGAEGIGLCRTEHMFFSEERIFAIREMILSSDAASRATALAKLLPFQRGDFAAIFREMAGLPVTIRLLDPPLHEFLPHTDAQMNALAEAMGVSVEALQRKRVELQEFNPMLGHRGCRLAITFPEIYAMQTRAILEAACDIAAEGLAVHPEIMIPLAATRQELDILKALVTATAQTVFQEKRREVPYHYGTMIELPRAALLAGELAQSAEFFSFGTNDLTQTALGLSRDDAGTFLGAYLEARIFGRDPFQTLDAAGVGQLIQIACEKGRAARPGLTLGVCGEHGGDPDSIAFFARVGLDYVSCSPYRVTTARLAAAQAALGLRKAREEATT